MASAEELSILEELTPPRVPWPNYGVTADAEKITAEDFNKFMKAFPEFFNGVMTSFGQ